MNEKMKDVLRVAYTELTQVQLKLKMMKFLLDNGARVNEKELDKLLERFENLKKLIEDIVKSYEIDKFRRILLIYSFDIVKHTGCYILDF